MIETISVFFEDNAPRLGASVAFYTMLSLAPLLVVAIGVAGLVFGEQAAKGQIFWQVAELVGPEGGEAIQRMVENASKPSQGILAAVMGLATLFFGATTAVAEIRAALNRLWGVPALQGSAFESILQLLRERFFSFTLVVGVGFLLLVSLLINAGMAAASRYVQIWTALPEPALQAGSSVMSFFVVTLLFSIIYKVLPDLRIEWNDVLLGAGVTSLLFTLGKLVIGIYLGKTALSSTYGAAGSLVIVLLWVYYSVQVFFLGATFTRVFADTYGSGTQLKAHRVILGSRETPEPPPPGETLIKE